jgi:hypothetical protein
LVASTIRPACAAARPGPVAALGNDLKRAAAAGIAFEHANRVAGAARLHGAGAGKPGQRGIFVAQTIAFGSDVGARREAVVDLAGNIIGRGELAVGRGTSRENDEHFEETLGIDRRSVKLCGARQAGARPFHCRHRANSECDPSAGLRHSTKLPAAAAK